MKISRRKLIERSLFTYGGLGLKSLLLGLPPTFLTKGILAQENSNSKTKLIYGFDSTGSPLNCNAPGSYEKTEGRDVKRAASFQTRNAIKCQLGETSLLAATPWGDLPSDLRINLNVCHHQNRAPAHIDALYIKTSHDKILSVSGGRGGEMIPSAIAQELSLQTVLSNPLNLSTETFSFKGINLPSNNALAIKNSFVIEENELLTYRNQILDRLKSDLKEEGTQAQRDFFDKFVQSRADAKKISEQLSQYMNDIFVDELEANLQDIKMIVLLLKQNICPVACMNIGFGGDNHNDGGFEDEEAGLISGLTHITALWNEMKAQEIQNDTTVCFQSVFGRSLTTSNGRRHYGPSTVTILFGPNVKGGISGEITEDLKGSYSLVSVCKTVFRSCGISEDRINARFREEVSDDKIIGSALKI